jgi:tyrosyl-tRNA synthetase
MPTIKPSNYEIVPLLVEAKICKSKSEARQVVDQGGVSINEIKVDKGDYGAVIKSGDIIKKGSRWFVKVK